MMQNIPDFLPVGLVEIKCPEGFEPNGCELSQHRPKIQKFGEYLVVDNYIQYPKIYSLIYYSFVGRFYCRLWNILHNFLESINLYHLCFNEKTGCRVLKCWKKEDHPNIKDLPEYTPRVVRKLFSADYQLFLIRMSSAESFFKDVRLAEEAWKSFLKNSDLKHTISKPNKLLIKKELK